MVILASAANHPDYHGSGHKLVSRRGRGGTAVSTGLEEYSTVSKSVAKQGIRSCIRVVS